MTILQSEDALNPLHIVTDLLRAALADDLPPGCTIRPARGAGQGDFTTNVAMVLPSGGNATARDIARELAQSLDQDDRIASVQVGGQGFLNASVTPLVWQRYFQSLTLAQMPQPTTTRRVFRPLAGDIRITQLLSALGNIAQTQGQALELVTDPAAAELHVVGRLDHTTIDSLRAQGVPNLGLRMVGEVTPPQDIQKIADAMGPKAFGLALMCGHMRKPLVLSQAQMTRETVHNPAFSLLHAQSQLSRDHQRCKGGGDVPEFTTAERLIAAQIAEFNAVLGRSHQQFSTDILSAYLIHLARLAHEWRDSWGRFPRLDPRNHGNSAPVLAKSSLVGAVMLVISRGICILT